LMLLWELIPIVMGTDPLLVRQIPPKADKLL